MMGIACPNAERDRLLDAIRGFALAVIVIDHFDVSLLSQFTPQMFGFSDMADLFVIVSGISCGIAYRRRIDRDGFAKSQHRAFHRAAQLYAAYLLSMLLIVPMTWIDSGRIPAFVEFTDPGFDGLNLWKVLLMSHSWGALPILKLYVICVVATPALVVLGRRRPIAVLGASAVVYAAVQLMTQAFDYRWSYDELFVDPLAWQFLFVIGVANGALTSDWKWPSRNPGIVLAAAAILQIAFAVKTIDGGDIPAAGKIELGPLRILHVCSLMIAMIWIESRPWGGFIVRSRPSQGLQFLGRHGLTAFCIGAVLVAAANLFLKIMVYSLEAQIVAVIATFAGLWGGVWCFSRWQARRPSSPEPIGAPQVHSQLVASSTGLRARVFD